MKGQVEIGQKWYRVTQVVAFLGWVDYYFINNLCPTKVCDQQSHPVLQSRCKCEPRQSRVTSKVATLSL